jgi:hypothetical protein
MAGSGALAKGIFAVVGKFFKESAVELRAPFRDLSLGGHDFALAGAGGGTLPSRRFGDEMRKWAQDAKRGEDGVAYSKRLPSSNSKKNTGGGLFGSKKEAEDAARETVNHGGRARFRDECAKGDHVHAEFLNKDGEVSETRHFGWRKK